MRITRVTLENIKSYSDETSIRFEQGVNLIKGENGAGKSTILEAIGYALFGSLPYKGKDFIRLGQKKGQICVSFTGYDGREYSIVRDISISSSNNAVKVYDEEMTGILADGTENVIECLRELLQIDDETDIAALFEDVVGVPQGTMTAIFAETPGVRASKFNKLLRVDTYRTAYDKLLETDKYIQKLIQENEREQANFQGQLVYLPSNEQEHAELSTILNEERATQAVNQAQLEEIDSALAQHETLKQTREATRQAAEAGRLRWLQLQERQKNAQAELAKSFEAQAILESNNESYQAYQNAEQQLQQLELQRRERAQISDARGKLQNQLDICLHDIKRLEQQITECREAEALLGTLEPKVQQQTDLEAALNKVRADQEERVRLTGKIEEGMQRCQRLQDEIAELDRRLMQRDELTERIGRLRQQRDELSMQRDGLNQSYQVAAAEHKSAQTKLSEQQERERKYKQAQRDVQRCAEQVDQQEAEVLRLHRVLDERVNLTQQLVEFENERKVAQTNMTNATSNRLSLEGQVRDLQERRTLLDTSAALCPICQRSLDEHTRDDAAIHYERESQRLQDALKEIKVCEHTVAAEVKQLDQHIQSLRDQIEQFENEQVYDRAVAKLEALQQELAEYEAASCDYEDAPVSVETLDAEVRVLQSQLESLDQQRTELHNAQDALNTQIETHQADLNRLPQPTERDSKQNDYDESLSSLTNAQERFAQLATVDTRVHQLQSELASLDDPRTQYRLALNTASNRTSHETAQEARHAERVELENELAALDERFVAFDGLDDTVAAVRQSKADSTEGYQRYLRAEDAALLLDERQTLHDQVRAETGQAEQELAVLQADFAAADAAYDSQSHQQAVQERAVLDKQQTELNVRIENHAEQLADLEAKIDQLRNIQTRLTALEQKASQLKEELSRFQFVRKSIRDAAEEIRVRRVSTIGQDATRIFGDIIGDNSPLLEWGSDYGITLKQGSETRSFRQLSGGEQMAAALSIRLALLDQLSQVRFVFLDEPTTNLDEIRRDSLASKLRSLQNVEQLFIISHDDTFGQDGVHEVEIAKTDGLSRVIS